jgi:sodium-independent sulfate anion transporter 11
LTWFFSAHIDTTGVQLLVDTKKELEKWADAPVEFHFANILSPWVRRALIGGGFGTGNDDSPIEVAPVVPKNEEFADPGEDYRYAPESSSGKKSRPNTGDVEQGSSDDVYENKQQASSVAGSSEGPLLSTLTPYFHVDLPSAVKSAEAHAKQSNSSN